MIEGIPITHKSSFAGDWFSNVQIPIQHRRLLKWDSDVAESGFGQDEQLHVFRKTMFVAGKMIFFLDWCLNVIFSVQKQQFRLFQNIVFVAGKTNSF